MFLMTIREALAIQARQVEHYGFLYPGGTQALALEMAKRTKVPADADLDKAMPIFEVNRFVPRGGDIEHLVLGKDHGGN